MKSIRRKIDLYILSLGLLFVFFLIITAELPTSSFRLNDFASWKEFAASNPLPIASMFALLYCLFAYFRFDFDLKGATEIPFEIRKIEDINYEHLTFLATYVVPLISFDFGSRRQLIVLGLLLIVMGIIYIKTDLFYANPSLALLGFHIYRADGSFKNGEREGIILVCRGRLTEKQKVSYIKLDDRIYYVRGNT
ncbi:membrane protein [Steroidobacter denitrificans]|uniref:Membrane protein n=1 Tax=Steroidobacter denitrificans TaxID=465721 RepID=A0A127F7K9_STEDE|nr:anti-phage protein KwaA [Steroidobacter denitrificans]AMN45519.1 membrane protein [Steroidobacter denitrificans]